MSTFVLPQGRVSSRDKNIEPVGGIISAKSVQTQSLTTPTLVSPTVRADTLTNAVTVDVKDESVALGSFNTLNFVGANITVTDVTGVATITPDPAILSFEDSGVSQGNYSTINFTNATVTSAGDVTISQGLEAVLTVGNDATATDIININNLNSNETGPRGIEIRTDESTTANAGALGTIVISSHTGGSVSNSANGIAIGANADSLANGIALGTADAKTQAVCLGPSCVAQNYSVAVGSSTTSAANSVSLGQAAGTSSRGPKSVALTGTTFNTASAADAVSIGRANTVNDGGTLLTRQSTGTGDNVVAIGLQPVATANNIFSARLHTSNNTWLSYFTHAASPTVGPSLGAGTAVPANPDVWLKIDLGVTSYLMPLWEGAL